MKRFLVIFGASILIVAFCRPSSHPGPDASDAKRPDEAAGEAAASGAGVTRPGLRVYVDPETGELVGEPTEEQLEKLRLESSTRLRERRSSWDLRHFSLRGGGRGVFLDGWADHELVVRRADDGSLRTVCSQGETDEHPDEEEH